MKYEIEAAVNFLCAQFFPLPSSISHSHSTPSLPHPPSSSSSHSFLSTLSQLKLISADEHSTNKNFSNNFFEIEKNVNEKNVNENNGGKNVNENQKNVNEKNEKLAKLFSKMLSKTLAKKFATHWYEEEPIKGQAFRSILVDCENNFIDKVILHSARKIHWKNAENHVKTHCKIGFQMWIDPGEVEVEFLSPSSHSLSAPSLSSPSSSSSSSPYKSSPKLSNQIIYSIRRKVSATNSQPMNVHPINGRFISRPPSPPSSSSSPSLPSLSPPSSPAPSSYSPIENSPIDKMTPIDVKMPLFPRQNKPIRISVRQNDEKMEENFNQNSISEFDDINNNINNINNSSVKSSFAILQPAM